MLLLITQFVYNATPQKGLGTSLFKINYSYKLKILLTPRQAKKISKTVKKRMEKFIQLYQNLYKSAKLVQNYIKRYYNQKVSEGPDLKEGDKVYLLIKNFKSKRPSKKLNYVKMGLFKIINKVIEVLYRLDLLLKIKIYLVYYIAMLELVYKNHKLLIYK